VKVNAAAMLQITTEHCSALTNLPGDVHCAQYMLATMVLEHLKYSTQSNMYAAPHNMLMQKVNRLP
jgi:hypothetical protein